MSTPNTSSSGLPPIFLDAEGGSDSLPPNPMQGVPPHVSSLLARLHAESLEQEKAFEGKTAADFPGHTFAQVMADKFIALEEDKCHFLYQVARAIGAKTIVEVGTSYGVSTIYLALAAAANVKDTGGKGRVIGTEHEPGKAARARQHWDECGESVRDVIELREGDLRERLKEDTGTVDLVLLDSTSPFCERSLTAFARTRFTKLNVVWTPMALPALKLLQPNLRPGAVIIADNTAAAARDYKELFEHTRSPGSPFITSTLPFKGGLDFTVYLPRT